MKLVQAQASNYESNYRIRRQLEVFKTVQRICHSQIKEYQLKRYIKMITLQYLIVIIMPIKDGHQLIMSLRILILILLTSNNQIQIKKRILLLKLNRPEQ